MTFRMLGNDGMNDRTLYDNSETKLALEWTPRIYLWEPHKNTMNAGHYVPCSPSARSNYK
jgi:hypothetical protein